MLLIPASYCTACSRAFGTVGGDNDFSTGCWAIHESVLPTAACTSVDCPDGLHKARLHMALGPSEWHNDACSVNIQTQVLCLADSKP